MNTISMEYSTILTTKATNLVDICTFTHTLALPITHTHTHTNARAHAHVVCVILLVRISNSVRSHHFKVLSCTTQFLSLYFLTDGVFVSCYSCVSVCLNPIRLGFRIRCVKCFAHSIILCVSFLLYAIAHGFFIGRSHRDLSEQQIVFFVFEM